MLPQYNKLSSPGTVNKHNSMCMSGLVCGFSGDLLIMDQGIATFALNACVFSFIILKR